MNAKLVSALATVAAAVLVLGACAGPAATPSRAPTAVPTAAPTPGVTVPTSLITPGTVVDCVDIEYPPMEFFPSADVTDPAQAIGFDVDAAKAVAAHWGLDIEIHNTAFDALIPDLTNNRCDIVWTSLFVNDTRLEVAEAVPYLTTGHEVMVKAGNPDGITTVDDLCGKSVSIQSAGLVEEVINAASTACTDAGKTAIDIQGYPTVAEEFQQIVSGRVAAVWETDTAVGDWMKKHPGEYEIAVVVSRDRAYGVYFQKDTPDMAAAVAGALKTLNADGTLGDIAEQYGQDPSLLTPACPTGLTKGGCHSAE